MRKTRVHGNAIVCDGDAQQDVISVTTSRQEEEEDEKLRLQKVSKKKPFRQLLEYHHIKIYAGKCEFVIQYIK